MSARDDEICLKKTVEKNIFLDLCHHKRMDTNSDEILNSILPPREHTIDKHMVDLEPVLISSATTANMVQLGEVRDIRGVVNIYMRMIKKYMYLEVLGVFRR